MRSLPQPYTRRHIVRTAEGREKVIQGQFVGYVDGSERKTPFVMIAFEQVEDQVCDAVNLASIWYGQR